RGVEGARGGERADVELVDERTVHLDALPPGVGPGVGVRVEGARGPVDAVRLVGAARVRVGALAVDQEGVVGAGGQPGRVLPPPVRGGGHRCAVVADDEGDVGRVRRPDLDGDGAHLKTVPRCHASDRPGSRGSDGLGVGRRRARADHRQGRHLVRPCRARTVHRTRWVRGYELAPRTGRGRADRGVAGQAPRPRRPPAGPPSRTTVPSSYRAPYELGPGLRARSGVRPGTRAGTATRPAPAGPPGRTSPSLPWLGCPSRSTDPVARATRCRSSSGPRCRPTSRPSSRCTTPPAGPSTPTRWVARSQTPTGACSSPSLARRPARRRP